MHAVGTQAAPAYEGVASYAEALAALEEGLHAVEQTFTGLSDSEWQRTTVLDPLDAALPRWDVLTLAAHFDISIGLTLALLASAQEGQVGRDQVSFFIFDRNQVAPVVYQYALDVVKGHTPGTMMTKVRQTFASTLEAARSTPPSCG